MTELVFNFPASLKTECEEVIRTKYKARVLEEGWERRWPGSWGRPILLRKVAMMAVLRGLGG